MAGPLDKWTYTAAQTARVAWYLGHYLTAFRSAGPITPPGEPPRRPQSPVPDRKHILKELRALFAADWRNIERGLYAPPHDMAPAPLKGLFRSRRFFKDLPKLDERRLARRNAEVFAAEHKGKYPRYYLQNFHYQTDGYLSEDSAALYDTQVEILFGGAADAMRRQALVPLADMLRGRDQRRLRLLDVASGTARFLTFVKDNYPRLAVTALDLSAPYLEKAASNLRHWNDVSVLQANAEKIPLADNSEDIVTCIYLFHELPQKIRPVVAAEIARVLKPGGSFIFVDSLQAGDREDLNGLLEYFPIGLHEPYYENYLRADLKRLFARAGLTHKSTAQAFLSKVMVFEKPAQKNGAQKNQIRRAASDSAGCARGFPPACRATARA